MPSVREGELIFQFPEEVSCERFDGPEHGLSNRKMKAVDFILDAEDSYYFLEVKDPNHTKAKKKNQTKFMNTALFYTNSINQKIKREIFGFT